MQLQCILAGKFTLTNAFRNSFKLQHHGYLALRFVIINHNILADVRCSVFRCEKKIAYYTVNRKKRGSTFDIISFITLDKQNRFL